MAEGQIDVAAVEAAVADFKDPESGRGILKFEQIKDIQIADSQLSLTLALTTWSAPLWKETQDAVEEKLRVAFPQLTSVSVKLAVQERPPQKMGEIGLTAKSVIAIGSGKGGVGKSTIAACLAFALKRAGCQVGLLDSDVYGPSIPHLLGVRDRAVVEGERLLPIVKDGMPVMSMGLLVPEDEAVIWRGPMLHGALTQFLRDTAWGDLDYLIIDMPPGTGDLALTLSQLLPLTGAIVVCTPQDVALLDAVKAIAMFRKVNIPVLGVVENMSGFVCTDCGKHHDIFGSGGARRRAEELNVPFLGDLPINLQVREHGDEGKTEANLDDPSVASGLESICHKLVKNLAVSSAQSPPKVQLPVLG
ncbi:MAG: Mrp/NBP35 family ATP-binding protein [Planctomycetes bacterium]|nr:Mrp/NBP35 family ATP-binding protein [Planctomycetota bacterium]MBL7037206.1 Mrp/NBP35 family ATP-binding protein [Pirellulaceae bacterium]